MNNIGKSRQLVYNAVKCLDCGELLVSHHRHDYKTCECPNAACVDGGTAYLRYGAKDMSKTKLFTVYADDDYEIVRKYATRGSRGKDGKQPLTWIAICDMEDDHLEAVLDYGGADWHMDLIRKEIEYRKFKEKQKDSIIELMNMDSYDKSEQTEDALKLVLNDIKNTPEDVFNNQWESIKKTRSKKGCACYGSNEMHECFCK